ncbi:unnamed protein product, partial [Pocillopora meandrina]
REKASKSSGESECDEGHVETAEHQNTEKRLPASYSDSSENCTSEEEIDLGVPEGLRFINISVLASVFETVRCPLCKQGHAVLEEEKMGLASLPILKCSSSKCKFEKLFYTFNKVVNSQAFEVNRRVVLVTRNIGVGHQGLVKFCGVTNMLPPMQENLFQDHLKAVKNAAQTAAEKCMSKAADEVKGFYEPEQDDVYNYWRRRGFSSCYGVVT